MRANTLNKGAADLSSMLREAEAHIASGRLNAAASIYEQALGLAHENPDLHHTLGLVYLELDRPDPALFHLGRSIALNPLQSKYYRSMGDALGASKQSALAIFAYEKAHRTNPNDTDALLNLGGFLHALDRYKQAAHTFKKIISIDSNNIRALNNLGKVHHDMGQLEIALSCYDRCIAIQPDYAEARFNRAALLLAMGDYKKGWIEYEWRFKRSEAANVYPHQLTTPRWTGSSFQGRRLLVHCEQGMGDVLQFVRYLPMVKNRGGTLIVEAHPPLLSLLKGHPRIDELTAFDTAKPPTTPHDLHVPLLSLPSIFNTQTDTIPATSPYIQIDADISTPWQGCMKDNALNIGLFWAASDLNPKRNLPIDLCSAWFQYPDCHFIAVQKGEAQRLPANLTSCASSVTELGHRIRDFRDTAAVMANLDLMISVDTAAAHLAGAMGAPLWILLPFNADWRWSPFQERCPWYPKARVFRQSRMGDWQPIIDDITTALAELRSSRQPPESIRG